MTKEELINTLGEIAALQQSIAADDGAIQFAKTSIHSLLDNLNKVCERRIKNGDKLKELLALTECSEFAVEKQGHKITGSEFAVELEKQGHKIMEKKQCH